MIPVGCSRRKNIQIPSDWTDNREYREKRLLAALVPDWTFQEKSVLGSLVSFLALDRWDGWVSLRERRPKRSKHLSSELEGIQCHFETVEFIGLLSKWSKTLSFRIPEMLAKPRTSTEPPASAGICCAAMSSSLARNGGLAAAFRCFSRACRVNAYKFLVHLVTKYQVKSKLFLIILLRHEQSVSGEMKVAFALVSMGKSSWTMDKARKASGEWYQVSNKQQRVTNKAMGQKEKP